MNATHASETAAAISASVEPKLETLTASTDGPAPTPTELAGVLSLYEQGQVLSAFELSRQFGPIAQWRGPAGRLLAGRLANNLGSPRLGSSLHRLAYRESPDNPDVIYYYARNVFERRGTLEAWEFLTAHEALPSATTETRADWYSLHGLVLGWLRDFDEATAWLDRAHALCPERPWPWIERADLLERQDRYAEALAAARKSLEIRPWYRPGVQAAARLLQLMDRDREALSLLVEGCERLQSGPVALQLASLQTELAMHADARATLDRVVELSPLLDRYFAKYLAARRSDAAYYCGDIAAAIQLGRESENEFHKKVAETLAAGAGQGRRALLPVPFVRQHHLTCARRRFRPSAATGACRPSTWMSRRKFVSTARRPTTSGNGRWMPGTSPASSGSLGSPRWH